MADILKLNNNKITITDDVIDGRVLVSKTVNVGGLLQALVKLATGDNAEILTDANLTGATLTSATLTYANLGDANLTGADLTGAYLGEANLAGANLTDANLTEANLTEANLENANLTSATLTAATMPANADTKAEFKAVVGEGNWSATTTIWVDGEPIGE